MSSIDVTLFMVHSSRSASSAVAADSGKTTTDILKVGDWSTEEASLPPQVMILLIAELRCLARVIKLDHYIQYKHSLSCKTIFVKLHLLCGLQTVSLICETEPS